jgi:hypothetical protein
MPLADVTAGVAELVCIYRKDDPSPVLRRLDERLPDPARRHRAHSFIRKDD